MATINGMRLTFVGDGVAMRREWNDEQAQTRRRARAAAEAALEAEDERRGSEASTLAAATLADARRRSTVRGAIVRA